MHPQTTAPRLDSAGNCMSGKTPEIRATATTSYETSTPFEVKKKKTRQVCSNNGSDRPKPVVNNSSYLKTSQVISAMASSEAGILCVDKMGSPCTRIGCLCLQMGHSKDWRHWIRQSSTRHLEWKAWLQYSCPEEQHDLTWRMHCELIPLCTKCWFFTPPLQNEIIMTSKLPTCPLSGEEPLYSLTTLHFPPNVHRFLLDLLVKP